MTDDAITLLPYQQLSLAYAKAKNRRRYRFLFAFDNRLAEIIRSTTEPLIAQMRLAWWRDILKVAPDSRPQGEPLIALLNKIAITPYDVMALEQLLDGWEAVIQDFPWDKSQFEIYSKARGQAFFLFGLSEEKLSSSQSLVAQAWALWDFARHCSNATTRAAAFQRCSHILNSQGRVKLDRSGRPLSILYYLMAYDVRKTELSSDLHTPLNALRIMWHGMTGFN